MDCRRQQTLIEQGLDLWQTLWYNLRFYFKQLFNTSEESLKQDNTTIYILGQKLEITQENMEDQIENLKDILKATIWFTYRRNFPELLQSRYISDTGWGCMIRVGQMGLAQVLKKHMKSNGDKRDQDIENILVAFADDDEKEHEKLLKTVQNKNINDKFLCSYSIQKISVLAHQKFKLKPGEWYKPNNILYVLEELHERFPIRGSEKLKYHVFNDSSLFMEELSQKMFGVGVLCQNKDHIKDERLICSECLSQTKQRNSIAFQVLTRIGLDDPNADYIKMIDKMMELPQFQGIIGGSPSRALYIMGRIGQQYIYLDPHYVQEAVTKENISFSLNTFQCNVLHLILSSQIDCSMGIQFYLKDQNDFENFWEKISALKKQFQDNFFIYLSEKQPQIYQQNLEIYEDDDCVLVE